MNQEYTDYLFKNFPFFHPEAPLTESSMSYGFDCGDGWFNLIKKLCEKLMALDLEGFRVVQVKKKFSGLRFYVDFAPGIDGDKIETVSLLIEEAEEESYDICDICGKTSCLSC